ncbi:hypothetical protein CVIRNUC_001411 [Coccomyxa viridis]|uniref:NF-X1-type domain-containing protein n=1 Tax=Coccomyxa viridis TaxID=1274662 RepID=A0AAV1HW17_9CHLO|nr:hypothetical protein CVIRNUC_001411 [Coccomyxa viridis]
MPRMGGPKTGNKFTDIILQQYHAELDDDGREIGEQYKEGIARLQDFISTNEYSSNVCLVCLEQIAPHAAVWTCHEACFCMLHLMCAQGWANQQLRAAAAKASSQAANPDLSHGPASHSKAAASAWGCPKCRVEYPVAEAPRQYMCMCGAVADPAFDPWLLPHTCGATCGHELQPACGHSCLLLCHPGPCPPCPRQVTATCYCGKASAKRRCGAAQWSCTRLCGRVLPCGHRCPQKCHPGDCGPCKLTGSYSCRCGSTTETRSCEERDFQCGQPCMKTLQCGRCTCTLLCHAGDCGLCARAENQTCPCGKVMHSELPCDQEAPPCGATCGKTLLCGQHHCQERCHTGPCPATCRLLADKSCACGLTQRRMPCSQPLRCERRCTATRSCGRHQCKRRCCDGDCPPCDQPCGRKLRCGNHLCPSPCHSGPCQPCPLSALITCACGQTSYNTPCGTESAAKPPKCPEDCPVPRTCTHAARLPAHPCHFGACPPCTHPCGDKQRCGHACSARCHHPQPPPIPEFKAPLPPMSPGIQLIKARKPTAPCEPPALEVAAAVKAAEQPSTACPPCQQMLPVSCHGGHVTSFQHCSRAAPFACQAACGKPLECGNHACAALCHRLDTAQPHNGCSPCTLPCQRARSCEHPCPLPCHSGACPRCEEELRMPCHCTRSTISLACTNFQQAQKAGTEAVRKVLACGKVCHRLLEACPHLCEAACHAGPCPTECSALVTVRCACRRKKEKRPCDLARQQLQDAGLPAEIDGSSAVQLLSCDSKCHQLQAEKRQKTELSRREPEIPASASSSSTSPLLQTVSVRHLGTVTSKERKKANREERAAERKALALLKEKAERWAAWRRKWCIRVSLTLLALLAIFLLVGVIGMMLEPTEEEREAARQWARDMAERAIRLERERDPVRRAFRENLRNHLRRAFEDGPGGEDGGEVECDSCDSCYH